MSFSAPSKDSQVGFLLGAVTGVAVAYCLQAFSSPAKPSHVKLYYFDGRGLAEVPRTLLKLAGVEFEEERYQVHKNEEGKLVKPEMDKAAKEGKFEQNMGRVPILEVTVGGKTTSVGSSKAISRFIARTWGLYGKNDLDAARIDAICECIFDLKDAFNKEQDKEKWLSGTGSEQGDRQLKWFLESLDKMVDDQGFAVGSSPSLADAYIYNTLGETATTKGLFGKTNSEPMDNLKAVQEALKKHAKKLERIVQTFQNHEAIQTYLEQRKPGLF